jgi:hypothetical protein
VQELVVDREVVGRETEVRCQQAQREECDREGNAYSVGGKSRRAPVGKGLTHLMVSVCCSDV